MSLETAAFVSQLVSTNPPGSDPKAQGDDHLRMLKAVLQGTLPNASRAFRFPEVMTKTLNYVVSEADDNKTILYDTSLAGTLTLPVAPSFGGWAVRVVKVTSDVNPVFVAPPSGTINGFARIRVNVPFVEHVFVWTGSAYLRLLSGVSAAGTLEDFGGAVATVPSGYSYPFGQSLLRADFPELAAAWDVVHGASDGAHFNAPDFRGRVSVPPDDMGGVAANRLSATYFGAATGVAAIGGSGGSEGKTLFEVNLPPHTHEVVGTTGSENATHHHQHGQIINVPTGGGQTALAPTPHTAFGEEESAAHQHGMSFVSGGGAGVTTPFSIVQPGLLIPKIFRLC